VVQSDNATEPYLRAAGLDAGGAVRARLVELALVDVDVGAEPAGLHALPET
jgi:hypothetical protein